MCGEGSKLLEDSVFGDAGRTVLTCMFLRSSQNGTRVCRVNLKFQGDNVISPIWRVWVCLCVDCTVDLNFLEAKVSRDEDKSADAYADAIFPI